MVAENNHNNITRNLIFIMKKTTIAIIITDQSGQRTVLSIGSFFNHWEDGEDNEETGGKDKERREWKRIKEQLKKENWKGQQC